MIRLQTESSKQCLLPAFLGKGLTLLALLLMSVAFPAWAEPFAVETKLTANDAAEEDRFGIAVGISGDRAIVSTPTDDDAGDGSGSAYLFDVATGNQLFKLTANDAAEGDAFGENMAAAISGDTAIVGAPNKSFGSGSAYLFDVATGNQLKKLIASDASRDNRFGNSAAIDNGIAIVGSMFDDVDGNMSGSAYIFDADPLSPTFGDELFKLTSTDDAAGDQFGNSVGISGDIAVVGAFHNDDAGNSSGSAYLFDVTSGNQLVKLTASDAAEQDWFGQTVAISDGVAIVGSPFDDDAGNQSGSAYLFDADPLSPTFGDELFKLTASDAVVLQWFGNSVAISGNLAIVGANRGFGSAYVFDVNTGNQLAKLTASDPVGTDYFGFSVGISGSTVIVGAPLQDGVGSESGSAYLYAIPEPTTFALFLAATLSCIVMRWR